MAYIGMACVGMAYVVMGGVVMVYHTMVHIVIAYVVMAYIVAGCVVMVYNAMADIVMAYAVVAYIGDGHAVPFEVKGNDCVAYCGKLEVGDVMLLDATHPHAGPAPGDTQQIGDTMHGHASACVHMAMHMWRQSCICSNLRHSAATFQPVCVTL